MNKIEFLFRWTHVWAGIIWAGHLYFFNFVNLQLQGKLDDPTKKLVNPQLMPRALWWFRWGAMITFLSGLILFAQIYCYTPGLGWGANMILKGVEGGLSDRARWIMWGMVFGGIMWFNVWFIIWPTQKKILSGQVAAEALPDARKKALLFSRINTYLSGPMLMGMLGAGHYGAVNAVTLTVFFAVALAGIWVAIAHAGKVGQSV